MADPRPEPSGDSGSTTGAPVWVKVFGIVVLIAVVLFVVVMLAGGGHGPGLHGPP